MFINIKVLLIIIGLGFNNPEPMLTLDYNDFKNKIETKSDELRIYNFWATWCAPCIKEMPYFEAAVKNMENTKLVFVSIDDDRKPERVEAFIEKLEIISPVWLLSEKEQKNWKRQLEKDWSGAIPATLFVAADGTKHFHTGLMSEKKFKELIAAYR
ncbi:TlpA family protein disulfide reductase [Cyclobacterium sp. 1_MG-2023]|uniref:TlpA family protein disulfide reductase n=1 Tax=Cyclobacterium sp. 1_MG-2023 TaxID=3062681 RepID=UPI0026E1F59A|nr:TlpA family protein disulfide reductase [Cyclobacterium sp. 1_MG-2023]MDO6437984.1 TlpA family protein disulfide reductase [Cyclobacterium sp. 1_MG-2023]